MLAIAPNTSATRERVQAPMQQLVPTRPTLMGSSVESMYNDWRAIGCGTVGGLIGQMLLRDRGRVADMRALEPAYPTGYNVRATTAGPNSVDAVRAGVLEQNRLYAVSAWARIYPEAGAPRMMTRVELGEPTVQYYSRRARSYQTIGPAGALTAQLCAHAAQATRGERCSLTVTGATASGTEIINIDPGSQFAGRWPANAIDTDDVVTMVVSVPLRTIGHSGTKARLLARVGADFVEKPAGVAWLQAGTSNLQRIGPAWSSVSFTAFRSGGVQAPGGGPPANFLIANPPPCAKG